MSPINKGGFFFSLKCHLLILNGVPLQSLRNAREEKILVLHCVDRYSVFLEAVFLNTAIRVPLFFPTELTGDL